MAEPISDPEIVIPISNPDDDSIWGVLKSEIRKYVSSDVKRTGKQALEKVMLPGDTEVDLLDEAAIQLYYDVADFPAWYFNLPSDQWDNLAIALKKPVAVLPALRSAIADTVNDNIEELLAINQIPDGVYNENLAETIINDLSQHVANWQSWYWEFLKESRIDDYFELKSLKEDIYDDDDYGALSNITDGSIFDGYSDVPYIGLPE